MNQIIALQKALSKIKPKHDTPFGRLHPYWARKPLNIMRVIIKILSKRNHIVADPFMGCGTTVFASLLEKRRSLGFDINPLATLIAKSTLSLSKITNAQLQRVDVFLKGLEKEMRPWYEDFERKEIVERVRFNVRGKFAKGEFKLVPAELVLKSIDNEGQINGRRTVCHPSKVTICSDPHEQLINSPIDFDNTDLLENARIAIPRGAKLAHYFTIRNRAAINLVLQHINSSSSENNDIKDILLFLLSTSLPLLRLSDYKASSQWPYWRPKNRLTSRNPIFVFRKRFRELQAAHVWLLANLPKFKFEEKLKIVTNNSKSRKLAVTVANKPFQELSATALKGKIDLIVTDPPYSDQVPYLEYSSLWVKALGLTLPKNAYDLEIVKTDASGRKEHSNSYAKKLIHALFVCAELVKPNGYVVWFYQDSDLQNWSALFKASREYGLNILSVIPISKQRRSMKTVITPGRTFDGDLILVFQKNKTVDKNKKNQHMDLILKDCQRVIKTASDAEFFQKYALVIQKGFEEGWLGQVGSHYKNIKLFFENIEA